MIRLICVLLLCLGACTPKQNVVPLPTGSTVAVSGFIQPQYDWELMAGVLPENSAKVSAETLVDMNMKTMDMLQKTGRNVLPYTAVKGCEEIALANKSRQRMETVEYWKAVGKCLKVNYLLVPFITEWHERDGGEWGVNRPASVTLDMYLIDVENGQVTRYHYEEMQKGLAENLLEGKRFFKRSGKWVTAEEITLEAFESGLKELGL